LAQLGLSTVKDFKERKETSMSNWLKAGLIGAAVVVVLDFVELIPGAACCTWIPEWVTYGCVGALAAYWMTPTRIAGPAAGQGALAGLIAGAIGGAVGVVLSVLSTAVLGTAGFLSQIPGDALRGMQDAGVDPGLIFAPVGMAFFGSICCTVGVAIAAGLGALGGIIFVAIRPGESTEAPV
jgi:hypothetical protein